MSAIRSLTGEKRTLRGHRFSVAFEARRWLNKPQVQFPLYLHSYWMLRTDAIKR
jgi:hypothetical protein